jgi:phosphodiesterase/alkaline phosphatase D-like protein
LGNDLAGNPNNGDLSVGSGQSAVSKPRTLSGLQPNTTYYFEIEANQVNGSSVATGATLSFTTPSTAVTNAASSITATSATLNGTVNPNGTQSWMQYYWGTSPSFGKYLAGSPNNGDLSVGSGQSAVSEPRTLSGLQPNTTYYFEIEANQVNGSNVATGATLSFTTPIP